jgi:GxxExxY protein
MRTRLRCLCAAASVFLLSQVSVPGASQTTQAEEIDSKVQAFLDSHKYQWRYENVVEEDGQVLFDLIVENKVIIELKCVERLNNAHRKQLLTYLRLSGIKLGYLMNFSEFLMKKGINRLVNGLVENKNPFKRTSACPAPLREKKSQPKPLRVR